MVNEKIAKKDQYFVNCTNECFYRLKSSQRQVEFIISTEDGATSNGSFIASEAFILFMMEYLSPLEENVFNSLCEAFEDNRTQRP